MLRHRTRGLCIYAEREGGEDGKGGGFYRPRECQDLGAQKPTSIRNPSGFNRNQTTVNDMIRVFVCFFAHLLVFCLFVCLFVFNCKHNPPHFSGILRPRPLDPSPLKYFFQVLPSTTRKYFCLEISKSCLTY